MNTLVSRGVRNYDVLLYCQKKKKNSLLTKQFCWLVSAFLLSFNVPNYTKSQDGSNNTVGIATVVLFTDHSFNAIILQVLPGKKLVVVIHYLDILFFSALPDGHGYGCKNVLLL